MNTAVTAAREDVSSTYAKVGNLHPSFLLRLLDEIDYGLLVVNAWGQVQHANHLARHELGTGRLLFGGPDGTVACTTSALTAQLMDAIASGLRGRRRLLYLKNDAHTLPVAVVPLSHALEDPAGSVLLLLARQCAGDNLALQMFAREHSLTPAEESVLRALCDGREVEEIAQQHGVAESTVRTQVRALRDKTGASGIRHLVQRVMTLPPVVPALRGDGVTRRSMVPEVQFV